jgi:hypothetical protein
MDVHGLLVDLAACLCEENTACGSPSLCFCGVIPGAQPIDMSGVDCDPAGQAWVRLVTGYPSKAVGQPDTSVGNLESGLGFTIEVGILRYFPIQSEAMEDEDILIASEQQITDMMAIYRAITCCPALTVKDYILGTYTPLGPAGGLAGGQWTLSVGLI